MSLLYGGLGLALSLAAQEATPPLQPIAEVNRLLGDPSSTEPRRMTFRGVVTFVSRVGDICVQEGNAGVMVEPPAGTPRPLVGDDVEVTAAVRFASIDVTDPDFFLKAQSVRPLGPGTLPEPERPRLLEALNGKSSRRWVEVEGVVMQARLENGVVLLHLTDTSGWAVVSVHDWRGGATPRDWWGARLRLRCANVGRGHRALRVATSDQITVLRPGTAGVFDAPLADPAALHKGNPLADRLRLEGTVLAVHAGHVYLRSNGTPLRASLLSPYTATEGAPAGMELIPPPVPEMKPGDRLELVGSPLVTKRYLQMSFSSFRVTGHGEVPEPVASDGPALTGSAQCDRVRLSGQMLWREQSARGGGLFQETLGVESRGTIIHAVMESERGGHLATFQKDDVLELTGVAIPPEGGQPPLLRLSGLQELGPPEVAVIQHPLSPTVVRVIAFMGFGLVAALVGAWCLQREVKRRTTALAVANENLRTEVAAHQQTEAELDRMLATERELGELKGRFVTMVSHEFRTPLGITMSAIELLRHHDDKLDPEQRRQLFDDIHRSTRGMGGLMEQVLVLGRVEAGTVGCRPAPVDLPALMQKFADETLSVTNQRCPIHWKAENDLAGARADETLLRHIFSNLLSNAVKYSPEGTPVDLECHRERDDAILIVRDRGLGIPEADRSRLFEAFHRCGNVRDIPGTGLGLVIVKRCVEMHGGAISFESAVGHGTTFIVRLPLWGVDG